MRVCVCVCLCVFVCVCVRVWESHVDVVTDGFTDSLMVTENNRARNGQ